MVVFFFRLLNQHDVTISRNNREFRNWCRTFDAHRSNHATSLKLTSTLLVREPQLNCQHDDAAAAPPCLSPTPCRKHPPCVVTASTVCFPDLHCERNCPIAQTQGLRGQHAFPQLARALYSCIVTSVQYRALGYTPACLQLPHVPRTHTHTLTYTHIRTRTRITYGST